MLLLGDSIVFGVGLPQGATMDRCLESELRVSTGHSWQVFNGGVVAYTSYQGLDLLNEIGPRLRPDVVVVAYRCNDLSQDLVEDHRRLVGGVFPPLRRLLWKTSLYRLIRTQVLGPSPGNQKVEMNRVGARSRVPLEQFRNHLEELGRVSRQFGAAAVVYLALPNRLTEGPEALSCPYRRALLAVGGWDVVCLDLVTPWVKLGLDPEEMFLPGSSDHFTPRGMAVLARIMVDLLRRNPRLAAAVSQREQRVASR